MESLKISFWGDMETSARTLETVPARFADLWNSARFRMNTSEVKRMELYLKRLKVTQKELEGILKKFKPIAMDVEATKVEIHIRPEEGSVILHDNKRKDLGVPLEVPSRL